MYHFLRGGLRSVLLLEEGRDLEAVTARVNITYLDSRAKPIRAQLSLK